MTDNWSFATTTPTPLKLSWYSGTPWVGTLYTRDDILAGAPVLYSPDHYSKASQIFAKGLLGYNPPDSLWAASFNEMVWNTMMNGALESSGWMLHSNEIYDLATGTRLIDVYHGILPNLDPNYNYGQFMGVLVNSANTNMELLVYTAPIPIPPAIWLFSAGLGGLIGFLRRKKRA